MIGKRAIAFDIGDRRIGVAISDPFNEYAMPCETYFRTHRFGVDVEAVANIAKERGVGVIVCGMPVNFDGTESVQTVKTQEFIEALKKKKINALDVVFPVLTVVVGLMLAFGNGLDVMIIIVGVLLTIDGVIGLAGALKK